MKTIVMSRRRPELSRDAFRDYYETRHVPLAIEHARFTKYVRNHLIAPSNAEFDVVLEFWMADEDEVSALDNSPGGATLVAHAGNFIGPERFRAIAEESLLAGPPRGYEGGGRVQKYAMLLNRHAYSAEADFIADARDWGRRLAVLARAKRVTIDVVKPVGGPFPANAILWLWLDRVFDAGLTENPPRPIEVGAILTLDAYETPRDKLVPGP